jgi:tetratricopeptide (TPR) repeat protein
MIIETGKYFLVFSISTIQLCHEQLLKGLFPARYEYIFFIDGSSSSSIRSDLIAHVRSVSSEYSQAMFKEALSFLCNPTRPNWILIFDNVDDVNLDITPFLPQCNHGSIIITTRNRSLGTLATQDNFHIELGAMSIPEATESILKSSRREQSEANQESARAIAEELGCLPVALIQAGCYIFESHCTFGEYLRMLKNYRVPLMDAPVADRQRRGAYATFDISYKCLPSSVQKFLHLLSFGHYANFPMAIIPYAAQQGFAYEPYGFVEHGEPFDSAISLLKEIFVSEEIGTLDDRTIPQIAIILQKYSLASFISSSGSLLLRRHPLAHAWAYDRTEVEKRAIFKAAAARLVACGSSGTIFERHLVPHIDTLLSTEETIPTSMNELAGFASILWRMSRGKDAQRIWLDIFSRVTEMCAPDDLKIANAALCLSATYEDDDIYMRELVQQAVDIRERRLGKDHCDTLDATGRLSHAYVRHEEYKKAKKLREQVLESMKRTLGPTHLKTIKCMGELAVIYLREGQLARAESLEIEVLKDLQEQLGELHEDTLKTMQTLGVIYSSQGKYQQAEGIQTQTYQKYAKRLGLTHLQTLSAIHDLSETYHAMGAYARAEAIQLPVMQELREEFGETQVTMIAKEDLAMTYQGQGRYTEAEALQLQVLESRERHLGEPHPETIQAMQKLASTYHLQANYPKAEEMKHKVLVLQYENHGAFHTGTIYAMSDLALTYEYQSRHREAISLHLSVLNGVKDILGEKHYETLKAMEKLGYSYQRVGRYKEAEELHQIVYKERAERMGRDQPYTLDSMRHLGAVYHLQGRYAEAEEIQIEVVKGRTEKLGPKHSNTLTAMQDLANTYCSQGRYSESERLHSEVLDARTQSLGESHSETLQAMSYIARLHRMQSRLNEAEELQRRIIDGSTNLGENHLTILSYKYELSVTLATLGQYEQAENLQFEVINARTERLGVNHPDTVDAKGGLAQTHRLRSRFTEAERLAQEVYMSRKERLGSNHVCTALVMYDLAAIYFEIGRPYKAKKLIEKNMEVVRISVGTEHPYYQRSLELSHKIEGAIAAQKPSRIKSIVNRFIY